MEIFYLYIYGPSKANFLDCHGSRVLKEKKYVGEREELSNYPKTAAHQDLDQESQDRANMSKAFNLPESLFEEYSPIVTAFIARLEARKSEQPRLGLGLGSGPRILRAVNDEDDDEGEQEEECEEENDAELDLSNTKMNPYRLWKLLERLGYKKTRYDNNGWELDFWMHFEKPGCKSLLAWGCGITFNLWLTEANK